MFLRFSFYILLRNGFQEWLNQAFCELFFYNFSTVLVLNLQNDIKKLGGITIGKRTNYKEIMKLNGWLMGDARYRAMLDCITPKCYVEASTTNQSGEVISVIYNMYNVPVCLKVRHGSGKIDYISVDRIDFWEPFNNFYTDLSEYEHTEGLVESLVEAGYVWDEERKCYYNEEYDDEIDWQVR